SDLGKAVAATLEVDNPDRALELGFPGEPVSVEATEGASRRLRRRGRSDSEHANKTPINDGRGLPCGAHSHCPCAPTSQDSGVVPDLWLCSVSQAASRLPGNVSAIVCRSSRKPVQRADDTTGRR